MGPQGVGLEVGSPGGGAGGGVPRGGWVGLEVGSWLDQVCRMTGLRGKHEHNREQGTKSTGPHHSRRSLVGATWTRPTNGMSFMES